MIFIENEHLFNNAIVCLNPSIHKCAYVFTFTVMKAAQIIFTLFLYFHGIQGWLFKIPFNNTRISSDDK